jgi:hypothetical protein
MEAVSRETFFAWAFKLDIGLDPHYPDSGCLSIVPPRSHARFWVFPGDPAEGFHFAATLLAGLDEWESAHLWPRSGCWPESRKPWPHNEAIRNVVLRGAGVPGGWPGAVRLLHSEEDELLAVLFVYLAFGWCVDDDLFLIPDHGQQLLQTDHHGVIHVECTSEERVLTMVEYMADAGYDLPTEVPDPTFRRPAWMTSDQPGSS